MANAGSRGSLHRRAVGRSRHVGRLRSAPHVSPAPSAARDARLCRKAREIGLLCGERSERFSRKAEALEEIRKFPARRKCAMPPGGGAKLDPRNQHGLSVAGFNVMLRLDRSIHWVTMPFFAVDSCGFPTCGAPQNDTLWKGFNAGFFATDCQLENCGSSLGGGGGIAGRFAKRALPGNCAVLF